MDHISGILFVGICLLFSTWLVLGVSYQRSVSQVEPAPATDEIPPRLFQVRRRGEVMPGLMNERQIHDLLRCGQLSERDELLEEGSEDWLPILHTDISRTQARQDFRMDQPRASGRVRRGSGDVLIAQAEALNSVGAWMYLVNPIAAFGMRRAAKRLREAGESME